MMAAERDLTDARKRWEEKDAATERQAFNSAKWRALELTQDPDELERILKDDRAVINMVLDREAAMPSSPEAHRARLGARWLSDISTEAPPPMLLDRLDPMGQTILFGPGGVGKGLLSTSWIKRLVLQGRKPLILDYENHPEEWSRRLHGMGGDASQVMHVSPLGAGWTTKRGPIWDQQEDIKALCVAYERDYLVIDSIAFACVGEEVVAPKAAVNFGTALEFIGLPALSLAHVNRANDMTQPFGSAFWHNAARCTWSMEPHQDGAVITHRKHNNYAAEPQQLVTSEWVDGRPVRVEESLLAAVLPDRLHWMLSTLGPTSIIDLVEELNDGGLPGSEVTKAQVKKAMQRNPGRFESDGQHSPDAKWSAK